MFFALPLFTQMKLLSVCVERSKDTAEHCCLVLLLLLLNYQIIHILITRFVDSEGNGVETFSIL